MKPPETRRLPRRRVFGPRPVRYTTLALFVSLAVTGCGGGGGDPAASPAPNTTSSSAAAPAAGPAAVDIKDYAFAPATVNAAVGQPITWTELDEDIAGKGAHSVVADDKSFSSELIKKGKTFSFTPKKAGTITYICGIHNYMKGTITVA